MTEIFLSNKKKSNLKGLNKILLNNKILCNITEIKSIVYNKKENKHNLEFGFKLDLFNDELDNEFFKCFMELRKELKINCLWINTKTFSGCIMEYIPFIKFEQSVLKLDNLLKCSEY